MPLGANSSLLYTAHDLTAVVRRARRRSKRLPPDARFSQSHPLSCVGRASSGVQRPPKLRKVPVAALLNTPPCVCTPLPSHSRPYSTQSRLTAFEKAKTDTHSPLAARQRAQFYPFVCETLGVFGGKCDAFVQLIYRFAADRDPTDLLAGLKARSAVAVALQRAVAAAVRGVMALVRPKPAHSDRRIAAAQAAAAVDRDAALRGV